MGRLRQPNEAEATFLLHVKALNLPPVVREYRFDAIRRWRFDFAQVEFLIAIEIEGGTWQGGRHNRGVGFRNDCIKYNTALMQGWRVIRVTPDQVKDGQAVKWYEYLVKATRIAHHMPACVILSHMEGEDTKKAIDPGRTIFSSLQQEQKQQAIQRLQLARGGRETEQPSPELDQVQALLVSKLRNQQ